MLDSSSKFCRPTMGPSRQENQQSRPLAATMVTVLQNLLHFFFAKKSEHVLFEFVLFDLFSSPFEEGQILLILDSPLTCRWLVLGWINLEASKIFLLKTSKRAFRWCGICVCVCFKKRVVVGVWLWSWVFVGCFALRFLDSGSQPLFRFRRFVLRGFSWISCSKKSARGAKKPFGEHSLESIFGLPRAGSHHQWCKHVLESEQKKGWMRLDYGFQLLLNARVICCNVGLCQVQSSKLEGRRLESFWLWMILWLCGFVFWNS